MTDQSALMPAFYNARNLVLRLIGLPCPLTGLPAGASPDLSYAWQPHQRPAP